MRTPDPHPHCLPAAAVPLSPRIAAGAAFCTQFEPVYSAFTDFLSAELPSVKFMRVDADAHKSALSQFDIGTLPEIVTLKKGHKKAVPYTGVHSEWDMRAFARKLVAPPIGRLDDAEAVESLLSENLNATIVLGMFKASEKGSDEYEDWVEASKELSLRADIILADVDASLHARYKAKPELWFARTPALVLHRPVDGGVVPGSGGRTEEDRAAVELETLTEGSIERWVDSNRIPACGALDPKTFEYYERLGPYPLPLPLPHRNASICWCRISRAG